MSGESYTRHEDWLTGQVGPVDRAHEVTRGTSRLSVQRGTCFYCYLLMLLLSLFLVVGEVVVDAVIVLPPFEHVLVATAPGILGGAM